MKKRHIEKTRPRPQVPALFALNGAAHPSPRLERTLAIAAYAVIGLCAAALLVMVFGPHRIGDYFTETDFYGAYAEGARLVQRGVLDPSRYGVIGPLYEIVLGLTGFVIRDLFIAAQLIAVASAGLTLLFWFWLLRVRTDVRIAVAAVAVIASNAYFFRYGYAATTDALALMLQAATLCVLLTAGSPRAVLLAGVLAGAAFLTRYTSIALLAAGVIALWQGWAPAQGRRAPALGFAAGFALITLPWIAYSLVRGSGFHFQLHHNIAYDVFARSRGIAWDDYQRTLQPQFNSLWDVIARDPAAVFQRMGFNVYDHLRLDLKNLLGGPIALVVVAGVALGALDRLLPRLAAVWIAGGLLFGALVPAFYSERYSLVLLPVYATLAALAIGSPRWALVLNRAPGLWLKPALGAIAIGLALAASVRFQARTIDQLPVEVLDAARTLRELRRPGDRVIARKSHIAYHGGVTALPFPFADSLEALAESARTTGARWLFMSWPEAETRPALAYLLDTAAVVPGLTPRHVTAPHPAVLYEIGPAFGTKPAWLSSDTMLAYHTMRARLLVDGSDANALYNLALLERLRGNAPEAARLATLAARVDPKMANAQLLRGVLAQERGDAETSISAYQRVLDLEPQNVKARLGLGWSYVMSGDPQAAAATWRPVIESTQDPATLDRMRSLFGQVGDAGAVRRATEQLVRAGYP